MLLLLLLLRLSLAFWSGGAGRNVGVVLQGLVLPGCPQPQPPRGQGHGAKRVQPQCWQHLRPRLLTYLFRRVWSSFDLSLAWIALKARHARTRVYANRQTAVLSALRLLERQLRRPPCRLGPISEAGRHSRQHRTRRAARLLADGTRARAGMRAGDLAHVGAPIGTAGSNCASCNA